MLHNTAYQSIYKQVKFLHIPHKDLELAKQYQTQLLSYYNTIHHSQHITG